MQDLDLKQLNRAYKIMEEAFDLAVKGQFPIGLQALDIHMTVKGALTLIGTALKEAYEEQIAALAVEPAQDED